MCQESIYVYFMLLILQWAYVFLGHLH